MFFSFFIFWIVFVRLFFGINFILPRCPPTTFYTLPITIYTNIVT